MDRVEVHPIHSEVGYQAALKEIEEYFEREPKPDTPEADRFDLLALVIEDYENKHWPIEAPDPIEAIKFRMEQKGLGQADLVKLLGSRSRASEILNRRRHLTLRQIWRLSRKWGIPAESLVKPYRLKTSGLSKGLTKSHRPKATRASRSVKPRKAYG